MSTYVPKNKFGKKLIIYKKTTDEVDERLRPSGSLKWEEWSAIEKISRIDFTMERTLLCEKRLIEPKQTESAMLAFRQFLILCRLIDNPRKRLIPPPLADRYFHRLLLEVEKLRHIENHIFDGRHLKHSLSPHTWIEMEYTMKQVKKLFPQYDRSIWHWPELHPSQ